MAEETNSNDAKKNKKNKKNKKGKPKGRAFRCRVLVISVTPAAAALIASIVLAYQVRAHVTALPTRGQYGDFWGGYLGAGGTLAGAFLFFGALLLQSNELKL